MLEQIRESVASVWELLWNAKTEEEIRLAISTMRSVMKAGCITHKDVADWIRKDRLEIGGLEDVKSYPEQAIDNEETLRLVERLLYVHNNRIHDKEKEFLSDLLTRLSSKHTRRPTHKQMRWLMDIARRNGEA